VERKTSESSRSRPGNDPATAAHKSLRDETHRILTWCGPGAAHTSQPLEQRVEPESRGRAKRTSKTLIKLLRMTLYRLALNCSSLPPAQHVLDGGLGAGLDRQSCLCGEFPVDCAPALSHSQFRRKLCRDWARLQAAAGDLRELGCDGI